MRIVVNLSLANVIDPAGSRGSLEISRQAQRRVMECKGGCVKIKQVLEEYSAPDVENWYAAHWELHDFNNIADRENCAICLDCKKPWPTSVECEHDFLDYEFISLKIDCEVYKDYSKIDTDELTSWHFKCTKCSKKLVGYCD